MVQECGMISLYNGQKLPSMNMMPIIQQQISMYGFVMGSLDWKYKEEFFQVVPKLLANGRLKFKEDISKGLENMGQGFHDVHCGKNLGKKVVVVTD
jgi:NADPH-dependent curcumin reductase CurA